MDSDRVFLEIAGLSILVDGPAELLRALHTDRYRDFHSARTDCDTRISVRDSVTPTTGIVPPPGDMVFDSGTVWSLHESPDRLSVLLRLPSEDRVPYRLATFDRDLTSGEIVTLAGPGSPGFEDSYDPLEFPLSEILTVCLLARSRGLMVHACGVISDGRGLLFPGNSTDGKSTMARIWAGSAPILNDDRIILRPSAGGIRMYGTPWHGDVSDVSAEGAVLESVYFLSHGEKNSLERVSGAAAVSMLLSRSFLPLWSREGMEFTLEFCSGIADSVPCSSLSFVPDSRVLEFLR